MNSIAFNAKMVRAILDGRKTQTRRISKKGEVGDVLWVKEGICLCDKTKIPCNRYSKHWYGNQSLRIVYAADGPINDLKNVHGEPLRFDSPIFMERKMARLFIRITSVRQERLQEIPDYAYWREGYMRCENDHNPYDWFVATWDSTYGDRPGCAWADNPLVWVHEFRVVEAAR